MLRHACQSNCEARVNRRFRLTRSTDFKRVRNEGKSYAHPLVVLVAAHSEEPGLRVGVSATRALGGAVQRNRAKRLLRESMRPFIPTLLTGWDLVLIARNPLVAAQFNDVKTAVYGLLRRANLIDVNQKPDDVR